MIAQALKKITRLLQGKIPDKFDCAAMENERDRQFAEAFNDLVASISEIHQFVNPLASGQLSNVKWSPRNYLVSPFKELHSRLCHLTWQTKQVAGGDYGQRVDFMGEFSDAFNYMITALKRNETMLKEKIDQLEQALGHIQRLEGILPICANCKRIRMEGGEPQDPKNWVPIEHYLCARTDAKISHTICPECRQKLYPEFADLKPDKR